MITLHEAYLKAKSYGEKYGLTRLVDCRDYGDFWGFDFVSPPIPIEQFKEYKIAV